MLTLNYIMNEMRLHVFTANDWVYFLWWCNSWKCMTKSKSNCDFQNTVEKCIVYLSHPTIFLSKSDVYQVPIFILVLEDLINHLQSLLLSQLQSVMDSCNSKLQSTTNYFNYIRCNWSRWLPTFILQNPKIDSSRGKFIFLKFISRFLLDVFNN